MGCSWRVGKCGKSSEQLVASRCKWANLRNNPKSSTPATKVTAVTSHWAISHYHISTEKKIHYVTMIRNQPKSSHYSMSVYPTGQNKSMVGSVSFSWDPDTTAARLVWGLGLWRQLTRLCKHVSILGFNPYRIITNSKIKSFQIDSNHVSILCASQMISRWSVVISM